jgi:hypothetical protein
MEETCSRVAYPLWKTHSQCELLDSILHMMLTQRSQVLKCFIKSKTEVYIQEKIGWSDQRSGSRIERGGASYCKVGSRI